MRHPKPKTWPRSWMQAVSVGGPLTLKGRSFEAEYIVMTERVEAETPEQLVDAVTERMRKAPS